LSKKEISEVILLRKYAEASWPGKGSKGAATAKKPVENFLGVKGEGSIQRWLVGGASPQGIHLVKLRYFLEIVGYRVSALVNLKKSSPVIYRLGEAIAFGVLSSEEVTKTLKYPAMGSLFRVLHGQILCSDARERIILNICESNNEAINLARARYESEFTNTKSLPAKEVSPVVPPTSLVSKKTNDVVTVSVSRNSLIESVGHGLLGLLPLMETIVSDDFSPEERKHLREVMGYDVAGRVIEALRKLTSERARTQLMGKGEVE